MSYATQTNKSAGGAKMFKLHLKNGVAVSTLEELRDNFDVEAVADYFKSGELLTWLEDRFYDDEADAISAIPVGDDNFVVKICAALNVECDDNLEFMRRVREKKSVLAEKTDDEKIIDNAVSTALNQEDLATLIHMDYKTIFLCGEQFNIPIRVDNMRYVGILCTPKIKIRATSQADLDAKNISFENVQLSWQKAAPIDELRALAEKIFQTGGKFPIVKNGKQVSTFDKLIKAEKSAALRLFANGKYSESQIAFLQLTDDFSSGFAMTIDSFCTGGNVGTNIIPYKKINKVSDYHGEDGLRIFHSLKTDVYFYSREYSYLICQTYNVEACAKLFRDADYAKIVNFLEVAKNF